MRSVFDSINYEDSEQLSVLKVENLSYYPHWHSDHELIFVTSGTTRIFINTESRLLHAGSLVVCSSNDIHNYDSHGFTSEIIAIRYRNNFIDPQIQRQLVNVHFSSPFFYSELLEQAGLSRKIEDIFLSCFDEMQNQALNYKLVIKSRIMEFWALALRCFAVAEPPEEHNELMKDVSLMQQILTYIDRNLSSDLTLDVLAEQFHLSQFYFSRMFKRMMGLNFKNYLNRYRINKSKNLLFNTNRKITDIAFECGYGSIRQFNRMFRIENGRSPSQFREQFAGSNMLEYL